MTRNITWVRSYGVLMTARSVRVDKNRITRAMTSENSIHECPMVPHSSKMSHNMNKIMKMWKNKNT